MVSTDRVVRRLLPRFSRIGSRGTLRSRIMVVSRSKTQGNGTLTAIIAAFVAPVLTLGLAWLVGNSLTTRWDTVKKQAELDLAAMEQFYKIYGEFFAVWKLWEDAIQ